MANDATRLNNFDNLVYIETRDAKLFLKELLKITKPAKIVEAGPKPTGIGFWGIIEILAEGQNKKRAPRIKKSEPTKTEIMELNNG